MDNIDRLIEHSQHGTGTWQKSDEVLRFYGHDDFEESGMGDFFRQHGIPVYEVRNDFTPRFFARLERVFASIFGKKAGTS